MLSTHYIAVAQGNLVLLMEEQGLCKIRVWKDDISDIVQSIFKQADGHQGLTGHVSGRQLEQNLEDLEIWRLIASPDVWPSITTTRGKR